MSASVPSCGHVGVPTANEIHAGKGNDKGTICIDCYREKDRERHRRYRDDGATPATQRLATANHPSAKKKPVTPAQQVALDILRDARAASKAEGWVYLVAEKNCPLAVKIGWTAKDPPESRLGDYQAGNPRPLVMVGTIPGTKQDEKRLHHKYISLNVLGEWFRPTPELLSEFNLTMRKLQRAGRSA